MKKIALLLTILCTSQLYGMEPEKKKDLGAFEQLPKELRQEITKMALVAASTTVDEAVKAIQDASLIYGGVQLDDTAAINLLIQSIPNDLDQAIKATKNLQGTELKDFTKLTHILANKFDITTEEIANKFNTTISEKYKKLGETLLSNIRSANKDSVITLISRDADINFSEERYVMYKIDYRKKIITPLSTAKELRFHPYDSLRREEILEILIEAGAK